MNSNPRATTSSFLIVFLLFTSAGCRNLWQSEPAGPPFAPDAALSTFDIEPGFEIQLFAAEPLIADPVAMEIDEYGRVYVIEMPGYPLDVGGSGRVRLLTDTTGDGRPDRSTVFADGLTLPTGVMRWKNGILVTDAPHVWYLEDRNGDGWADSREIVLTGFALTNPQHNFNAPHFGLDNWIYLANSGTISTELFPELFGDEGDEIHFRGLADGPRLPRNALGRNVRFRPDTHQLEMLSGWSQFGHTFDAWGRHLLVSNAHHLFHEVIAARYLNRQPDLPVTSAVHHTPDHGNAAEIFPITRNPEHQLLTDRGVLTSASGLTWYLGGAFPEEYERVTFVAEPVHNLVHVDHLRDAGSTFVAGRLHEDREFLASTDSWFRPVTFYVGPDGALYLVDYYRRFVEHPQWMDDETARRTDLQSGKDHGRIYRIAPKGVAGTRWTSRLRLGESPLDELVSLLAHPNIWHRKTAQRLLLDRREPGTPALLSRLAEESALPLGRLHALWTLEGLGELESEQIRRALQDPVAGVRENAVRLAELHIARDPQLEPALLDLVEDSDPKVRFQLLCTLGELTSQRAEAARRRLLFRDIEDEWVHVAALSARTGVGPGLLAEMLERLMDLESPGRHAFLSRLAAFTGARRRPDEIRPLFDSLRGASGVGSEWWRGALLEGLASGLATRRPDPLTLERERFWLAEQAVRPVSARVRRAGLEVLETLGLPTRVPLGRLFNQAQRISLDADADWDFRVDAVRLLALAEDEAWGSVFRQLIDPRQPAPVQRAAVLALGRLPGAQVAEFLLEKWPAMTPAVRDEAVGAMLRQPGRVRKLLEAIEARIVEPTAVDWPRRVRLMQHRDPELRALARRLLSEPAESRQELVRRFEPALAMPANLARGAQVFEQACSRCHQLGGRGGDFGPDLGTVRHWTPQALLSKILDPSRSIADGFQMWIVELEDGEVLSGLIARESPTAITLKNSDLQEWMVARSQVRSLRTTGVSAMPNGLEFEIDLQQMADLIEFLRHRR